MDPEQTSHSSAPTDTLVKDDDEKSAVAGRNKMLKPDRTDKMVRLSYDKEQRHG